MKVLSEETLVNVLIELLKRDLTQKEIAETLDLDSGTISRRMAELEGLGLVTRDRSHGPYRLEYRELTGDMIVSSASLAARHQARVSKQSDDHLARVLDAHGRNGGGR